MGYVKLIYTRYGRGHTIPQSRIGTLAVRRSADPRHDNGPGNSVLARYFVAVYSSCSIRSGSRSFPRTAAPELPSTTLPSVTVIIAARNEKRRIADKLQNTLQLAYPEHLLILVASDASDDGTDEIAAAFAQRNVAVVRSPSAGARSTHSRWR